MGHIEDMLSQSFLQHLMDFIPHLSAVVVILTAILVRNSLKTKTHGPKIKSPPEPPGAWPIIGHLHFFGRQPTMARTLADFADKLGPIFTIRMGMRPAVVVSSWETVKECFTINDKAFATRPSSSVGDYLSYNYAGFGFAPDGPYWREIKKLVLLEVLSSKRLEALKHVRVSEIDTSIKELCADIYEKNNGENSTLSAKVVISEWMEQLSVNLLLKTVAGKRYANRSDGAEDREGKNFRRIMREFFYLSGQFVPSDFILIPMLRWMDFGGHIKSIKRIAEELDCIIQGWYEEHADQRRLESKVGDDQDFVDVMLSVIGHDQVMYGHTRETIVKSTIMTMILAGAESTSILLVWILSLLLNNQHVMKRAKQEIDTKVGKDRWVEESDIKNLIYIQAIVKETLRLYPPAPHAVPHEAKEDCKVSGYLIPKGTRLFLNVWKLHRDPRIWSEPNEFRPERFLMSHAEVDVVSGQHFVYAPFGSGRRSCPGAALAMQVAHLTVARLLQGFDFETMPADTPVDMTEGQGFTLTKAKPLEVIITPRLPNLLNGI